MAEQYAHKTHFDFSGGVNKAVGRLIMADNECDLIENGELEYIGPISKVRGYSQRGADVNATYNILGMCNAYKTDGTTKQIVVADDSGDSDAYTYNPVTDVWTPHNLSLSSGSRAEFEFFLDGFFMVNFTEATRWNDYTQWYTNTNVTNAAKAKYIQLYLSRIYLAYVNDGTTYPSRVTYSDLPSSGTIAWDDSVNYFDVDADDGDVIKALEVNANRLLIFKEKSLHRYDTNTRYKVPGCPGTVSQRSVANIQGWTLYFHSTGLWGYNGTSSKLLSRRIQDIINGIQTKNFATTNAWVKGDHYYLYVGNVTNTNKGINIAKCLLDYDVSKNAFTWRSLEKEPTVFGSYRDDRTDITYNQVTLTYGDADTPYSGVVTSEDRMFFGATDGAVYRFDDGRQYDGTNIPFLVETRDYYLGYPAIFKLMQKVHVFVNSGKGVTVQFKMDDGRWNTLGKVTKTQSELIFPNATRGKRIKFRISESGNTDQFSFEGLDIYFTPEGLIE